MAGLLHDLRTRVVVLVDAVSETHQAEAGILVLRARHVLRNALHVANLFQHLEGSFVGATMRRAPQAGDAGRDAGKRIGTRGPGQANRRGRCVLLVVGMQDEDAIQRAGEDRIDLVFLGRHGEAHAQEVLGVIEIVARINEGLADRVFVGHGGNRRHLRNHAVAGDRALQRVIDVGRVVVEG